MTLKIENSETYDLAHRLAEITGETVNDAVAQSVRERLERIEKEGLAERILAFGKAFAAKIPGPPMKSTDHGDLLYDENGLPK